MNRAHGFHVNPIDFSRPTKAAHLWRLTNQVLRDGKFRRGCPDLCDAGLEGAMY